MVARVSQHGVDVELVTGATLDRGDGYRTQAFVVETDHCRLDDPGVAFERGPYRLRLDLVPTAKDGLVGAADDPEKAVPVESPQVGRTHPVVGAQLRGTHFEEPDLVDTELDAPLRIDDAQVAPGMGASDTASLRRRELLMIGQVPSGHRSRELGGAEGREHGYAVARR